MKLKLLPVIAGFGAVCTVLAGAASATVVSYTDELTFQAAMTGSFTLANLDNAPFTTGTVSPNDANFLLLGIDVITQTSIVDGQAFQISKPGRDRLLLNGSGSIGADFAFDFLTPQNGVGVLPNVGDGGRIRIFSGLNLTGTLLGEANFGAPAGSFGGISSDQAFRSVQITCDFDPDFKCGLYDLQFGTSAPLSVVPLPAALPLFGSGLAFMGFMGWRRKRMATTA